MLRRKLFGFLLAAPLPAAVNQEKPVRHVVLNWSNHRSPKSRLPHGCVDIQEELWRGKSKVLLDGREIRWVWYVDTFAGVIGTYGVFPDGPRANLTPSGYKEWRRDGNEFSVTFDDVTVYQYSPADFPGREVDCAPDNALSETLRGHVQIVDSVTGELLYGRPQ